MENKEFEDFLLAYSGALSTIEDDLCYFLYSPGFDLSLKHWVSCDLIQLYNIAYI